LAGIAVLIDQLRDDARASLPPVHSLLSADEIFA